MSSASCRAALLGLDARHTMSMRRSVDYVALLVDVWLFMVLPTVFALTKSILPISQGEAPPH